MQNDRRYFVADWLTISSVVSSISEVTTLRQDRNRYYGRPA